MKSRLLLLLLLAIILFVLLGQNRQEIRGTILGLIDPIKSHYKNLTQDLKDKSHSYLFQKEQIQKLTKENRVLRKYLLDQTHYLRQVASLYKQLPSLEKLPYKSITLVDTISYVKLNKFDEVLLSIPRKTPLKEGKVYGLIQDEVVAGTARMQGGVLYGYLLPNPQCRFSVFVGPKRHPGIAEGVADKLMAVRFIPKWAHVAKGDLVETSGLDRIFFAYIPVGVVQKVVVEGSYKTAYIKTYADTLHPRIFFLITDPNPYLVSQYDQNASFPGRPYPYASQPPLNRDKNISSVPETIQTQELQIDPSEFEIPKEPPPTPKTPPPPAQKKEKSTTKTPHQWR
jgi:rod shape-determining protein MreC